MINRSGWGEVHRKHSEIRQDKVAPRRHVQVEKAAVGFTAMRSVPSGAVRWKWQGK